MRMRTTITSLLAVGAVSASGGLALASTTQHARPARGGLVTGNVSLRVLAPTRNEVVKGPFLALHVLARGYKLDAYYAGTPDLSYIGHYHEILDGKLVDMTPLHGPNVDTISMVGVTRGKHVLTLVPTRNDHSAITSKAVNIPFYYEGPYRPQPAGYTGTGTPSITITSPKPDSTVRGISFNMTASIRNFVLSQDSYAKNLVSGEGHWHIFADKVDMAHMLTMAPTATQEVPIKGLARGWHTFYAVLVSNQHMPVMPMTMTSVKLFVR
jgi:hypothetical protein